MCLALTFSTMSSSPTTLLRFVSDTSSVFACRAQASRRHVEKRACRGLHTGPHHLPMTGFHHCVHLYSFVLVSSPGHFKKSMVVCSSHTPMYFKRQPGVREFSSAVLKCEVVQFMLVPFMVVQFDACIFMCVLAVQRNLTLALFGFDMSYVTSMRSHRLDPEDRDRESNCRRSGLWDRSKILQAFIG